MKPFLSLLTICFAVTAFGQAPILDGKAAGISIVSPTDSVPRVMYLTPESKTDQPACFLGGEFIKGHQLTTIDPNMIAAIDVSKEEVVVENATYVGRVNITMLDAYEPKWITLKDLAAKYLKEDDRAMLFMIDDQPVIEASDQFWVDEDYILAIKVAPMGQKDMQVRLIRVLTRKEENKKALHPIRLKG
jgi:hypothetical protein